MFNLELPLIMLVLRFLATTTNCTCASFFYHKISQVYLSVPSTYILRIQCSYLNPFTLFPWLNTERYENSKLFLFNTIESST